MALLPFQQAEQLQAAAAGGTCLGLGSSSAPGLSSGGSGGGGGDCSMEDEAEDGQARQGRYLSGCLVEVARQAEGLSGRTLRKLPFLAHAGSDFPGGACACLPFVSALLAAVQRERADRDALAAQ